MDVDPWRTQTVTNDFVGKKKIGPLRCPFFGGQNTLLKMFTHFKHLPGGVPWVRWDQKTFRTSKNLGHLKVILLMLQTPLCDILTP